MTKASRKCVLLSTGISFGRSKLLQSCSNFTLKPELKKTVNSLFSRQRCSGGFVYWICSYTEQRFKAIAILFRHLQCRYSKDLLFRKNIYYTVLNGVLNGLQRESWSFSKIYPLSVLTIVYNSSVLSLFASQAGQCFVLCDHHGDVVR